MRANEFLKEDEPVKIKLGNNDAAKAWIEKVYTKYPHTMQNNHVMVWGEGDEQQFAMFELTPSFSKRGAVEVKWIQAYPLRQGVGSRAMQELQSLAKEDGISLTLFPWDKGRVSQAKLMKFYKSQGFKPTVKGGKNMSWGPELNETRWNGSALYRHLVELENNKGVSNSTTLANLYNGNYPDRDETFWDYVNSSDFNKSIAIQTLPKHKVMIMLLGQYRAEHIDDVIDMLDGDRKELVQSYIDDPALSSKVIVILGNRIIDGNHRALAAAIKGSPINYVDLADLDDEVDEGVVDWAKRGAVAGAMALGALGSGQADAKPLQPTMKSAIAQPANDTSGHNVLSNNPDHEIVVLKAAKKAGFKGAELAQFMAQTKHESWDFARLKEKPQPGVKGYFAKKYDPKLAPKTAKILGNKKVGDGEKYHGRGFIQLTGRDNYRMAQQALGLPLLNNPEMASNPEVAAKIAIWYWNTRVKPNIRNFADTASVTKYINPAARGLENRNENFKDYMRII